MTHDETRNIACRLPGEEQDRQWEDVASEVFAAVEETRELDDGYGFRFPSDGEWVQTLTEYVLYERGCCPFFRFEIVLEADGGPVWLHLRGGEGARQFVGDQLRQRLGSDDVP